MSTQRYSVTPHPIETLLTWVKSGEIAIPEIQRPFVWEATKVRNLLDSLYQGYPVGYLIAWRNPTVKLKDGTSSAGKPLASRWRHTCSRSTRRISPHAAGLAASSRQILRSSIPAPVAVANLRQRLASGFRRMRGEKNMVLVVVGGGAARGREPFASSDVALH